MSNTRKPKSTKQPKPESLWVRALRSTTADPTVRTLRPLPSRAAAGMHRAAGNQPLARVAIQQHVQQGRRGQ